MSLSVNALKPGCRATIIVPIHDEEKRLLACLESLHAQTLSRSEFEVILLLNNCKDGSVEIAEQFRRSHPDFALHNVVLSLAKRDANVGTARRLLMDAASRRHSDSGAILSTDGDTLVANDWVEMNLKELSGGAELVGGTIGLRSDEYQHLSPQTRQQYDEDATYQTVCTRLESLLDPDPYDPWPRHHHNFGASLACANRLYRKLGGLPRVDSLEDVAFVNAAVRDDAHIRHSPFVRVCTTARRSGRARLGLASQLREWESFKGGRVVDSAAFLSLYFECRRELRESWSQQVAADLTAIAMKLGTSVAELSAKVSQARTFGELHDSFDLRGNLWRRMSRDRRVAPIETAIKEIQSLIGSLCVEERRSDTSLHTHRPSVAIPDGSENSRVHHRPSLDSPLQPA